MKFTTAENSTGITITGCDKRTDKIKIPATIGGARVTSIGSRAFYGCTGLTALTLPASVTSIGSRAFSGCSGLTALTLPEGIISIGDWALSGCTGLTALTLPARVTSIGSCAFSGCSGLTALTLPASVTSIGNDAFRGCTGLTESAILAGGWKRLFDMPQGEFAMYKKLGNGTICTLRVPAEARRVGGLLYRKCRVEFADVVEGEGGGKHDSNFHYSPGKRVIPDSYDPNPLLDCTHGIHGFLTRKEAEEY